MSRTGIEDATNSVAPAGRRVARSRATAGSLSPPSRSAASASPAASSASRQRASHAGRAGLEFTGELVRPRRPGRRGPALARRRLSGSCHAPSGSNATCGAVELREPAAQRLGDRQVADAQDEVRAQRLREAARRAAGRRSARSRRAAAATRRAGRRAAASSAGPPARAATRAPRSSRPATSTAARRLRKASVERACNGRATGALRRTYGAPPGRAPAVRSGGDRSRSGSRSGKFRCTAPGRPSQRRPVGAAGERADPAQRGRARRAAARPRRTTSRDEP